MQAFFKYAKQPSNQADFSSIFDDQAQFKFQRPPQAQRKAFFQQQFKGKIMNAFYFHLIRNKLLPGKDDQQITANIEGGNINHDDIIEAYYTYLQQPDTFFLYTQKPKQEKAPYYSYGGSAPTPVAREHKPMHALPSKKDQFKKDNNYLPAFNVERIQPGTPNLKHPTLTHHQNTPQHLPKPTPQLPPLQLNPHQQKSHHVRYLQKIADCFEYPQRWNRIRSDLSHLLRVDKKS